MKMETGYRKKQYRKQTQKEHTMKIRDEDILQAYEHERIRCTVYTRVMGYHRPVENFNLGKKGEHRERQYFHTEKLGVPWHRQAASNEAEEQVFHDSLS
jgi:hypothetical protein